MRAAIGLTLMACAALASAGCSTSNPFNRGSGHSTEFIAGNASSVLIDYAHGSDSELDAAHTLAVNRCTLFGRSAAVLDSINPRGEGKDRASFLCQ
jgi:hypothetical protein